MAMIATVQTAQAVVVTYNVSQTYAEPMLSYDTMFTGSFQYDTDTQTVSNLAGTLTQAMTCAGGGGVCNTLSLDNQLHAEYDATLGGLLVTTFKNTDTNTLSTMGGGDGWSPDSMPMYYGYPTGINPENAYARVFVNTTDPTAALTQAQINMLAYADCNPGSMMGAGMCMTGTTVEGYGQLGSMSGYPISQTIEVAPVPVPAAVWLFGSGLLGLVRVARRKAS